VREHYPGRTDPSSRALNFPSILRLGAPVVQRRERDYADLIKHCWARQPDYQEETRWPRDSIRHNSQGGIIRRAWSINGKTVHGLVGTEKVDCLSLLLLPAQIHNAGVPMPSYDSFMCPNCENDFRVIWPDPLPSHHDPRSKIKMKCPDCGEVTELFWMLGGSSIWTPTNRIWQNNFLWTVPPESECLQQISWM